MPAALRAAAVLGLLLAPPSAAQDVRVALFADGNCELRNGTRPIGCTLLSESTAVLYRYDRSSRQALRRFHFGRTCDDGSPSTSAAMSFTRCTPTEGGLSEQLVEEGTESGLSELVEEGTTSAAAASAAAAATDPLMTKRCIASGPPATHGSCLDGSPYCFYESLNASSSKWAFFFEGGGACETAEACVQRRANALGSSTNLSATTKNFEVGDLVEGWNRIYLPYCDGSVWKGTMTKPRQVVMPPHQSPHPQGHCGSYCANHGYKNDECGCDVCGSFGGCSFSCQPDNKTRFQCPPAAAEAQPAASAPSEYTACGHFNAAATLSTMLADTAAGFAKATHVIVSGGSAGGIGAFTHADYVSPHAIYP